METWLPIVVSLIALVISIASVLATWRAPQIAAHLAEGLRSAAARAERRDDLKRLVFMTLMQQRATPFTPEAVQAFNVIDAAFVDARAVREKWAVYYKSMDASQQVPPHTARQQLIELLAAMAADIGLTDIRFDDLTRSYNPAYVMRRINIETMTQAIQERDLQRVFSEASANTTPQASSTSSR
jgi:Mg-chelatase subunit ChlI